MTLTVWAEFVCGNCSTTAPGRHLTSGRIPMADMKREAQRSGWVFTRDDAYCNRWCRDQHTEQHP